jgi:hypothetical protein
MAARGTRAAAGLQRQRDATSSGNRQIQLLRAKTPNPSRANRPRRPIHRRSLAFRQRPLFDQHHTRPAPRAKLHAGRFLRDEKASSGLALKPTYLSALLTEQIAHYVH